MISYNDSDFIQRFNVSGCKKSASETNGYVTNAIERPTYLAALTAAYRIGI